MAKVVGEKQRESSLNPVKTAPNAVKDDIIPQKVSDSIEDLKTQSIESLMTSQANVNSLDPQMTMAFPKEEEDENKDIPSNKDSLLNDNAARLGGKRRFMMDGLCRALNTDMYIMEQDKAWAKNPLGKGQNVSIRYSREFPIIMVLYDNYNLMPDPKILHFKQKLANEHGYKYIYDTPEQKLNHDRLTELMDSQKHVCDPDILEKEQAK